MEREEGDLEPLLFIFREEDATDHNFQAECGRTVGATARKVPSNRL